ncbi:MAG: sulfatase activating formylglycine-generating enzyme, partial [Planctomycetota bacterium]
MLSQSIVLSLAAALSPAQDFGDYHALVIGNNAYENHRELTTAVDDAKAVSKLLREDYGFNVDELLDVTRQQIENALWDRAEKLSAKDNLLIYYAGHGYVDPQTNEGYWLGVDAGSSPRRWVSNATITTALKAIQAKHIMIVSDSCYSGSLTRGLNIERAQPNYHRKISRLKTRVALTSGGLEPVSDNGRDGHSVFAYEFLRALRGNTSILDGTALFKFVERPVFLAADQKPNYGDIRKCGHDGGDFLFVRKRGGAPPPPVEGSLHLVRGKISQVSHQSATIRVEGYASENMVFGSEDFVLPVATEAETLVLIAEVDGEERVRRTLDISGSTRTERFQGRSAQVHDVGSWRVPTLPVYVEGRLELPRGVNSARLRLGQDLTKAEDYDRELHVLERSQGSGAFRLVLPDTRTTVSLLVTAEGCKDTTVALRFDRAERGYSGTQRVRVLKLETLRLEPTRVVASLDALKDRSQYATLDKQAVEGLARAAESRWAQQFSGFTYQRVERFSAGGVSHWMAIWTHAKTGLEFVLVPGGRFQMGSSSSEADRSSDEKQHWVTLDPFLMARTECTQGAWAKVASGTSLDGAPSHFKGSELLPVEQVSAEDADIWCREASLMLPTEAQAEFAIRSGTTTPWTMSGNKSELRRFGNIGSAECPKAWIDKGWTESWRDGYGDQSAEVGKFEANAFGLFDVHGNLWEWCRDFYLDYDTRPELGTGMRLGTSALRVFRG